MDTKSYKTGSSITYYLNSDFDSNKETILFLHPAFANHQSFKHQLDYFHSTYNIVMIDLIGHGKSQGLKTTDSIADTSKHILEIMQSNNIKNIHLLGVSVGGLLAQDFMNKYPDKVSSIVAVGAYDINNYDPSFEKKQFKQQLSFMLKALFSIDAFSRGNAKISTYTEEAEADFYQMNLEFKRQSLKHMASLKNIMNQANTVPDTPILIMYGEYDSDLAKAMSELWIKSNPNSERIVITNAGHCANMDNPNEFNEAVYNFYQAIKQ